MKGYVKTGVTGGQGFTFVVIILFIILTGNDLFSQNIQSAATRQSSIEAFNEGDYKMAYMQFSELLITFPRDPLYKYYAGVCLVKLKREPEKAVTLLTEARHDGAVVRIVPADVLFWLGRAQQMTGRFDEAIASYTDFTEQSGRKEIRELGISEYIKQSKNKSGKLSDAELKKHLQEKMEDALTEESRKISDQQAEKGSEKAIPDNEPLTGDVEGVLSEAFDYQFKADSLNRIAEVQKNNLDKLSNREKTEARTKITENESIAASLQKQADQKFAEAQELMKKDSILREKSEPQPEKSKIKTYESGIGGTNKQVSEKKISLPANQHEGVLSLFRVDPNLVYSSDEKIQINPEHPPGLIYRIQVGVFRNPVVPSHFKGIVPVFGFKSKGAALTTYYAGMFRSLSDAKKALPAVRQTGFKDAFIVAFSEGKPLSSARAAMLEKEWSIIPFIADQKYLPDTPADTIPPVLIFRVEVVRSLKPVSEEDYEGMQKFGGTRGLDIETLPDGNISYLIGSFITFESAEDYADLLRRNGYRDAKVVAWLGNKEIPVETARKLFERIE